MKLLWALLRRWFHQIGRLFVLDLGHRSKDVKFKGECYHVLCSCGKVFCPCCPSDRCDAWHRFKKLWREQTKKRFPPR